VYLINAFHWLIAAGSKLVDEYAKSQRTHIENSGLQQHRLMMAEKRLLRRKHKVSRS
jgi:hypothetical protein